MQAEREKAACVLWAWGPGHLQVSEISTEITIKICFLEKQGKDALWAISPQP